MGETLKKQVTSSFRRTFRGKMGNVELLYFKSRKQNGEKLLVLDARLETCCYVGSIA